MTMNGSGSNDIFWFDPEDAQALVKEVLTEIFGKVVRIRLLKTASCG
jgi:hypothetical protein